VQNHESPRDQFKILYIARDSLRRSDLFMKKTAHHRNQSCRSLRAIWGKFWSALTITHIQLFQLRLSTRKAEKSNTSAKNCWEPLWKFINLLVIPSSLSRSYSTFPLCSWTTLTEIADTSWDYNINFPFQFVYYNLINTDQNRCYQHWQYIREHWLKGLSFARNVKVLLVCFK
jgi:urate oxidase